MTTKAVDKPNTALATRTGARGLENFDKKDLVLARISLMQGLSKLVTKEKKVPGTFVNTLTKETLGESVEFIPVSVTKYFDLLKQDPSDPTKMIFEGRTYNENDPKLIGRRFFNEDGLKANVNSVISYLVLLDGEPALLSFSKTSYKAGKKLGTIASLSGKDLFATTYRVKAKAESRKDNDYFVMEVEEVGDTSETDFKLAEKMYDNFGSRIGAIVDKAPGEDGAEHIDTTAEKAGVRQNPPEGQGGETAFEESEAASPYTKVRVLKSIRTDEEKKCPTCQEIRTIKDGNVKTTDPETGLLWGKVKAILCKKCNKVDVIEKLAD